MIARAVRALLPVQPEYFAAPLNRAERRAFDRRTRLERKAEARFKAMIEARKAAKS